MSTPTGRAGDRPPGRWRVAVRLADTLVGATLAAAPAVDRRLRAAGRALAGWGERVAAARWARRAAGSRAGVAARARLRRVRARAGAASRRWAAAGAEERRAGRIAVERALDRALTVWSERIAANPALQQAVRTASAGIAQTTLDEVRHRGERADQAAERRLRRLFRRPARAAAFEGGGGV